MWLNNLAKETWKSHRGLSGENAIPKANRIEGTTATPNIVLHLIKKIRKHNELHEREDEQWTLHLEVFWNKQNGEVKELIFQEEHKKSLNTLLALGSCYAISIVFHNLKQLHPGNNKEPPLPQR